MAIELNAGMERIIAAFEDGWSSGAAAGEPKAPYREASLREFWQDGYDAAVAERTREEQLTLH